MFFSERVKSRLLSGPNQCCHRGMQHAIDLDLLFVILVIPAVFAPRSLSSITSFDHRFTPLSSLQGPDQYDVFGPTLSVQPALPYISPLHTRGA